MTDDTPHSDLTNPSQDHPGQHDHQHTHSSHRHHPHSKSHRRNGGGWFRNFGKGPGRREDRSQRQNVRKTEAFLAKQFLKIVGILFILGAVWLTAGIYAPWKKISGTVSTTTFMEKVTKINPPSDLNAGTIIPLIILVVIVVILVFVSLRIKSLELELISLGVWILTALWWGFRYVETRNSMLLFGFLAAGSLICFCLFIGNIAVKSYHDGTRLKRTLESILILANSGFYYAAVFFLLYFSGHGTFIPAFTAVLLVTHILLYYIAGNKNLTYNKTPYLVFTGVILSVLLPWILHTEYYVLFFAVFSLYLMVYSKYSGDQSSLLLSLGAMTVMTFIWLFEWIFKFGPSFFAESLLPDPHLFYRGLLAGSFVLVTASVNYEVLKKLHISLSKKWFARSSYRRIMKVIILFSSYLLAFWAFNYIMTWLLPKQLIRPLTWCAFNCLYFIITIFILANQRSSFLPVVFILAVIMGLIYPMLVHSYTINLRDTYLETDSSFLPAFLYHYAVAVLLILMLLVLLRYVNRSFGGNKLFIKVYWVYFSLFILFLVFTEFNHLIVMLTYVRGMKITELIRRNREIVQSLLLMSCAFFILFTGLVRKIRFLRIFSLILLVAIIAKIIIIDLPTLGPLTKTMVFLFLGLMLLIVSVFYSRVKHFFMSRHSTHHNHNHNHSHRGSRPAVMPENTEGREG